MNISARNTLFDAVVFDFDGTLVDSAPAKRDSFYKLFPDTEPYRSIVTEVLSNDPDGSREVVIPRMVKMLRGRGFISASESEAPDLVAEYGRLALARVAACREMPGATDLLNRLSRDHRLHIFSNTPQNALTRLVRERGWDEFVDTVTGYPADKVATIASIIKHGNIEPARLAVVGDGISDRVAAEANGCIFLPVGAPDDVPTLRKPLGIDRV